MFRLFGGSTLRSSIVVGGLSLAVMCSAARAEAQSAAGPATSDPSQAPSEYQPIGTRIVSDPLFLPAAGQVYGLSAYTFDRPSGTNNKAGVATGTFTASDGLFNQTIAYGISNAFAIRVALGYGSNSRDSTAAATGDITTGNSSGFSDPTFSATYRLVDEPRQPFIVDITASYSPNTFSAQSAGNGMNGTIGRGGQNTGFSIGFGRVANGFTVAGTVTTTYVGLQSTELLANSTTSQSAAHWSYDVGFNTQTRFTERVSFNAGVTFSSAENYGVTNVTNGNSHTYDGPTTTAVTIALNYHFVPNRLVGSFTYEYDSLTDANNIFTNAKSDTSVTNRTGNTVGFRMAYIIN